MLGRINAEALTGHGTIFIIHKAPYYSDQDVKTYVAITWVMITLMLMCKYELTQITAFSAAEIRSHARQLDDDVLSTVFWIPGLGYVEPYPR